MKDKLIELELRAEVSLRRYKNLINQLAVLGKLHSQAKRLSVMYFGKINGKQIDLRVRVTNGNCEVVVKSGPFGSPERIEISQKIKPEQFLGMVKIFEQFEFTTKVGERKILNYSLPNHITASLVFTGLISYIELECLSNFSELKNNKHNLMKLARQLDIKILNAKEFNLLCQRLSDSVDWAFEGTAAHYKKLSTIFNQYLKLKNNSGS
ncbi:MAG: hypothetical protein A2729_01355 [Candidatus Buchananbacteria bacterium RIFCSPHIGHO2_01_FULL_39_14]|uniref:CYTH domain-containing protein n=2 Tax=Candidatus Buchananiibacteriota TaxID=1817903 RepID=A0A1G1YU32_9BACT|nr:MAG: hypothetical protein A2729_01355 [Candidatus Buchananbacteria bacterium RIFCSPHIGHO2_01_FULL_39_14]OGY49211.1 MAG: hypothetical protein A3D39_00380 [Candidatus Buchananbacteria bacterium RIFCSPHIGHO2_02_FULL_39_17]OGY55863.1 MAG: hypothetical protein A2912_02665 [Candidatus Buchananbacteria bacterium RIFCSPLOWO2_01_FULL_40_23b]